MTLPKNTIVLLLDSCQIVEVSSTWVYRSQGHEVHCQISWNHWAACHNLFLFFVPLHCYSRGLHCDCIVFRMTISPERRTTLNCSNCWVDQIDNNLKPLSWRGCPSKQSRARVPDRRWFSPRSHAGNAWLDTFRIGQLFPCLVSLAAVPLASLSVRWCSLFKRFFSFRHPQGLGHIQSAHIVFFYWSFPPHVVFSVLYMILRFYT
jgi:hypothetical protein